MYLIVLWEKYLSIIFIKYFIIFGEVKVVFWNYFIEMFIQFWYFDFIYDRKGILYNNMYMQVQGQDKRM